MAKVTGGILCLFKNGGITKWCIRSISSVNMFWNYPPHIILKLIICILENNWLSLSHSLTLQKYLLCGNIPDCSTLPPAGCKWWPLFKNMMATLGLRMCYMCLQVVKCWLGSCLSSQELQSPDWDGPDGGCFQLSAGTGTEIWLCVTVTQWCFVFLCPSSHLVFFRGFGVVSSEVWRFWVCQSPSCSSLYLVSGNETLDVSIHESVKKNWYNYKLLSISNYL